ncbi:Rhodanese-like domain-containing protein [Desulfuromusa kysingii]|uniref:Sulfurtransferase n=1 Tax=Desulfuromusa kysingii TaxID=37625 RepID=A0A1H3ZUG3_9BACT|nr:rhodanese-like domain-containing protein [Desulfuromusa kysingii]SEA27328.1 Rhodanese-like domain-containing protein [Desulfuromusa kysingii]
MMNRITKVLRYQKLLITLSTVLAVLLLGGCGGGGGKSYTDVDVKYYENDDNVSALLDAATLKSWVDNGYKTADGHRVVILDCVPNTAGAFTYSDTESWFAGDADKIRTNMEEQYGLNAPQYKMIAGLEAAGVLGHIPGALPSVSHEGYEVTPRNDGPVLADHEVGTGSLIDQMLCRLGITKDDVIVMTTSRQDYPGFCSSRLWWTLRYWGFAKEKIRVLDGGNRAYALYMKANFPAEEPLAQGVVTLANVTPSNFSVTELPKRFFDVRISIGELIDQVDSGRTSLADDDANKVVVLDARQPPTPFYFTDADANGAPDIFEVAGYTYDDTTQLFTGDLTLSELLFQEIDPATTTPRIPVFNMANPLPFDPADGAAWIKYQWKDDADPSKGMLVLPLGAKPAAFEGKVKGAKLVKNGSPQWNVTVPVVTEAYLPGAMPSTKYAEKQTLLNAFAAAGIDGSKPIIIYCNSGALASVYAFALQEICGFEDVRTYDGSWNEWAVLTAYEPADETYIKNNHYTTFPAYPVGIPSAVIFAARNNYFQWDDTENWFVDAATGVSVGSAIKLGGALSGNPAWDTVSRSENVMFRATKVLNDNGANTADNNSDSFLEKKTYVSGVNWPSVETYPDYDGFGDEVRYEDEDYNGSSSTTSGGEAPTAFTPTGGGC